MEKTLSIIRKQGGKYYVFSEDGSKRLGGPYATREEAVKRLQQVEYFKHQKGKSAMELGPTPTNKPANHPQDDKDMKKFKKKLDINLQGDPAGDRTKTDLVGTVAGLPSPFIVDKDAHFPITTEDQAKSAISRVLYSMYQAPDWFKGSIDDLRELVCKAVLIKYPKIQVKASVALNEMFAAIATKQEPVIEISKPTVKGRSELLAEYIAANVETERPETDLGTVIKNPNHNASKVPGITTPTIDYLKEYRNKPIYANSGTEYNKDNKYKLPDPLWGSLYTNASWDETGNQFRYRVKEPTLFDQGSFRTKEITNGVQIVIGKLKNAPSGSMITQAYHFNKDKFKTLEEAKSWLKNHVKADLVFLKAIENRRKEA